MLPIPVRVLAVAEDRVLTKVLERRFSPICRFDVAHSIRIADTRMGLTSTPFDAFIIDRGLPDGDGLSWFRKLRDAGESGRAVVICTDDDECLPRDAAAAGAVFVRRTDGDDWQVKGIRTFLERVATEHVLKTLLRRFAEERGFSDDEKSLFEAALWVKSEHLASLVRKEPPDVAACLDSMTRKSGLDSIDSAIIAALVRGILESLNGSGFDD
jgi:ActR/RegA family two-component response regulator